MWVGVVRVSGGEVSEKVSVDWCGGDEECVRHEYVHLSGSGEYDK